MVGLKHESYTVGSDFEGGYVIMAKVSALCGVPLIVARYDSEHGESFSPNVTDEQKEAIRKFAERAMVL